MRGSWPRPSWARAVPRCARRCASGASSARARCSRIRIPASSGSSLNVGILGGGQLGRMLALAGLPLGLRFRFLESQHPSPVDGLGETVRAAYDDQDAVRRFARGLDVVTYEFENVPDSTARLLEELLPVHPSAAALRTAQDRLAEKQAFETLAIPTAVFLPVDSRGQLESA